MATIEQRYKSLMCALWYVTKEIAPATAQKMEQRSLVPYSFDLSYSKTITSELVVRSFKFEDVDKALTGLQADGATFKLLDGSTYERVKASEAAALIAAYCQSKNIFWPDVTKNKTTEEVKEYRRSVFGAALWSARCFESQQLNPDLVDEPETTADSDPAAASDTLAAAPSSTASSSAPASSAPQATSAPTSTTRKNRTKTGHPTWKDTGAQSQNMRGLVGNPHEKVVADGRYIYFIASDKLGKKVQYLYTNPFKSKGNAGNNVNKVLEGPASDWQESECFFDTPQDADAFLVKAVKKFGWTADQRTLQNGAVITVYNSARATGFRVQRRTAKSNGYFIIETEFGQCAYNAIKCNEALENEEVPVPNEDLTEATKTVDPIAERKAKGRKITNEPKSEAKAYDIKNINVYEEAFKKYE